MGWFDREREIKALKLRVEDLEGRLCPCGHVWELVDKQCVHKGKQTKEVPRYKCMWCGKEKVGWD